MGMGEIDRLDIAIEAQAREAVKDIDSLYNKLNNVASALTRSAGAYRSSAKEIGRMAAAIRSLAAAKIPNLSQFVQQMQMLSKLDFKNFGTNKFKVDVEVNVPKTAEQIGYMLNQAIEKTKVNTEPIVDQICNEFGIRGSGVARVRQAVEGMRDVMSEAFDGEKALANVDGDAIDSAFETLTNAIVNEAHVLRSGLTGEMNAYEEELKAFYDYIRERKIDVSDYVKNQIGDELFNQFNKEMPTVLSRSGEGLRLDAVWEEMRSTFPNVITKGLSNVGDMLEFIRDRVIETRQALNETPVTSLTGSSFEHVFENIEGASSETIKQLEYSLRSSYAEAKKTIGQDLMLDINVNQEKIVSDIRSAINRASRSVDYDPVKVTLKIDKQHVTNAIANELKGMDAGNLPEIAQNYENLANSIGQLYTVSSNSSAINKMVSAVTRLAKVDMSAFDTGKFGEMLQSIQTLSTMGDVSSTVNNLINAITRLAKAGGEMAQASIALPDFANAVKAAFDVIASGNIDENANRLITSITRLAGSAGKMTDASIAIPALTASIKAFFDEMSRMPNVSDTTLRMTEALVKLSASGSKVERATTSASSGMRALSDSAHQAGSSMNSFGSIIKGVSSSMSSLVGSLVSTQAGLTKFALKAMTGFKSVGASAGNIHKATLSLKNLLGVAVGFYGIRSLFNWGKQSIELASNLTEVQNVVENAFGEEGTAAIEKFTQTSIEAYGLSELTAKQISSRYQAMGRAMGITAEQVDSANTRMSSHMIEAYAGTESGMHSMSMNLTKLAADMASFYNVEQDTVAEALNAVYTGQTRPLRRYGLDLTQATLQEWAMKQGIDAQMSSMTQAEKTMLRYQYVMANTTMIQGDFARTSMTWANQVRVLKQNFEVLGKTIGGTLINVFKPLVTWMNVVMKRVIAFAETVSNALGKIFGWTILHTPSGSTSEALEELADTADSSDALDGIGDSADSTADKLGDAAKAAKEFQETVLGFDELNKLSETTTPSGSGSSPSGGSGGSGAGGAATLPGIGAVAGEDFAITRTDNLMERYKSSIDSLFELGEYIGDTLKGALDNIDWNGVYLKASSFGSGLASFLNGLISPGLFDSVGRTIANSLNTALHFLDTFGSVFSWTNFGNSVGTGIRSMFENFDWDLSARVFGTFVNGYTAAFYSAIQQIPFYSIGSKISGAVRNALGRINWNTVFDIASSFGADLADFLSGLVNEDTFSTLGTTVGNLLKAEFLFLNNFGSELEWDKFGDSIAAAINGFFEKFKFSQVAHTLNTWALGLLTACTHAISRTDWKKIGQQIGDFLRNIKWEEMLTGVGDLLGAALQGVVDAAKALFDPEDLGTPFTDALDKIVESVNDFIGIAHLDLLASAIKGIIDALKPAVSGFAKGFMEVMNLLAKIGGAALLLIGAGLKVIAFALNSIPPEVVEALGEALGVFAGALVTINGLDKVVGIIGGVIAKFGGAATAAGQAATAAAGAGEATAAAGGAISGMAKTLLGGGTGIFAGVITGGTKFAETLQRVGERIRGENGKLSAMGTLMQMIGEKTTPELNGQIRGLVDTLEDTGYTTETAADKFAEFFAGKGIDPSILETYFSEVSSELNITDEQAELFARTIELMGEKYSGTATQIAMGRGEYETLNGVIVDLMKSTEIAGDHGLQLQEILSQHNGTSTAIEAYEAVRTELARLGYDTDSLDAMVRDRMPSMFGAIADGSDDATGKTSSFRDILWNMAGGMFAKTLLMAVMGSTFSDMGGEAEGAVEPVDNLQTHLGDFSDSVSSLGPELRTNAENAFANLPGGAELGINKGKQDVLNAIHDTCGSLLTYIEDTFDMHSPSRVMAGYGENIDQGFGQGIEDEQDSVLQPMKRMLDALSLSIGEFIQSMFPSGAEATGEFKQGMLSETLFDIPGSLWNSMDFQLFNSAMYNAGANAVYSFSRGMRSVYLPIPHLRFSASVQTYGDGGYSYSYSSGIDWYALGGFPNTGDLFIANENGPEMLGKMGNRNVVANNKQITEGIRAAVVDGMMEVYSMMNGSSHTQQPYQLNATLYMQNDEVLARSVERGMLRSNDRRMNKF